MEDLYADLENYQNENVVTELKNENQELKNKLEEYASTLASLQKDFDKLSEEYKRLELNYSSLLKTARAEIERKSQLITNLNIEKDKLVIESIQNRGRKPKRNFNTIANKQQTAKQWSKYGDSAKSENNAVLNTSDKNVCGTTNNNRRDKSEKVTPTVTSNLKDIPDTKEEEQKLVKCDIKKNENKIKRDRSSDALIKAAVNNDKSQSLLGSRVKDNPEVKDKEQKSNKLDNFRERDKKNENEFKSIKETDSGAFNNDVTANKVSKIRSRRKSMPLLNRGEFKFSSDEEQNDDPKDHRFRKNIPTREDRIDIDRNYDKYREHHGKYEPERKQPELPKTGHRQVIHQDASRDVNRKSYNMNREIDKYKSKDNRDRYDSKDNRDRYESKDNRNRYESKDNRDRYDSKDNRDRYESKDNRDRYESNQRSRRYFSPDRQCNTQAEYYNKQRDSSDRSHRFDNIRHRTLISPPPETYRQHIRSREFDGPGFHQDGHYPSKHKIHDNIEEPACKRFRSESLNKASEQMSMYDKDIQSRASSTSRPLELSYLSLQSPDYVYLENHPPVHQIKEIKSTSESKLDDPRLKTNKYIANNHKGKVVLSTVVGRNVDLKPINTVVWNTNKDNNRYDMPTALIEKPPITEDFIKDICMDIENPVSNLSLESGEICLEEEMGVVSENQKTGNIDSNYFKNVCSNVQSHDQNEINKIESVEKTDNGLQACPTFLSKNYKIPKLKRSNSPKFLEEGDTYNKLDKVHKKDNIKHSHKKKTHKEKRDLDKKSQAEANNYVSFGSTEMRKSTKHKVHNDKNHKKISPEKPKILPKDTVEGDLELSDETCDYLDVSDHTKYDKGNVVQKFEECNKDAVAGTIADRINKEHKSNSNKTEHTVFKLGIETMNENKHFKLLDKGQEFNSKEPLINTNKDNKSKDIKNKLSDLFGDTSSLITLDDLGVVVPAAEKETLNEYAPSFDNTQDAVDLNVEEMEEVQTRCMKSKRDENDSLLTDGTREGIEGKKGNKDKKVSKERRNSNNTDKGSSKQHGFKNVTTEPRDKTVVKTVIISTGLQNQCHSVGDARDKEAKQLASVQGKAKDNVTSVPAMLSIKALATSTPCKLQNELSLSVPETSHNSNNSTLTNDNNSSKTESSKVTQSNSDIPDVRIIVKRRRKTKGAP